MCLFFLREDGSGNITNEDGTEANDFDIESVLYSLNKPTDFEEYLKSKPLDVEMSENNSGEAISSKSVRDTSSGKDQHICYMMEQPMAFFLLEASKRLIYPSCGIQSQCEPYHHKQLVSEISERP